MSKIVTINSDILSVLRQSRVDSEQAKIYLLGIYFGVNIECVADEVQEKVDTLGIMEFTPKGTIWKVPLFNEEKEEEFAWIEAYRESFGRINPNRKGTKSACVSRMKKFFAANPGISKHDVRFAVEKYFKTVRDPTYLKSAHKFIYEGTGFNKVSMLEQYLEQVKAEGVSDGRSAKMN